jgi:uncharacterized membrane protein
MNSLLKNIKTTFLGGVFFLVPLIVLTLLFQKGNSIIQKITAPVVSVFPKTQILGVALQEVLTIFMVLLFCFLFGLLAKTWYAKKLIQKLEDNILGLVPGYSFMKNMNESLLGLESNEDLKVILVPTDAGLQFAFLVEEITENKFAVFIPDAPNPWSGSVCFVEKKDITEIDVSQKEAIACIRKLGYGSKELLKNKL